MSDIRYVKEGPDLPNFPATNQHPNAVRYRVGNYWVDAIGDEPTAQEVSDYVSPPSAAMDASSFNDALTAEGSVFRGFVLVVLDEINLLRAEIRALKTKAGIAGAVPDRTVSQIKPAIVGKMR